MPTQCNSRMSVKCRKGWFPPIIPIFATTSTPPAEQEYSSPDHQNTWAANSPRTQLAASVRRQSPWETPDVPEAPWHPEKIHGAIQLRKEIQPRKVRKKMEHKSWFSLVYTFFFQLNLYHQPRVWLYEKHTRPYGFCYTPEPRFSSPNPLSGLSFRTIYMQRRQEQHPESACVYFAIWHQNGSLPQGQCSMDALKLLKSRT